MSELEIVTFNYLNYPQSIGQYLVSIIDIDECAEGSSGCSDLCHNEIGSFHCSCYNGYHLSPENNSTCHGK